jgi:para-aminobenzoate synthetase / 4-amino-4-deoxychorismate lyase
MVKVSYGLENDSTAWSLSSVSSNQTISASQIDEVIPLLRAAESAAHEGAYVALMLSYEAAPAFDSALKTHEQSALPLAWAAILPQTENVASPPHGETFEPEWTPQIGREEYNSAIARIRDRIAAGETYQVNYSFPLTATFSGDTFDWYRSLSLAQGAKYCAYLDLGYHQILSMSPELFFERRGDTVRTRPMKGTIRRGRWNSEDEELARTLETSTKDKAENVMIVDLLRNDLGKVSIPGSVNVTSLFELERFETVWQMTSTVEGRLRNGTSLVELMSALFPCGSITGAPKIRTMEIIKELEPHPRGAYTGTIGFLRPGGDCIFNVAIRTVVVDSETGRATFGVGGGITIDSTAEREYEECLVKTRFLHTQQRTFDLFESILLEDGEYFLLERHLERLKDSANYFGFEYVEAKIRTNIDDLRQAHIEGSWKLKLTLSKDADVSTEVTAIGRGEKALVRVGLATTPIDSSDRLLFHKTTHRSFYTSQLAARPECDDVIFYNERGEVTESTIANVVVALDGKLVTPPISAGLLTGTFRNQLIDDGEIEERKITVGQLREVREFFLINSVRKWMKAVLE